MNLKAVPLVVIFLLCMPLIVYSQGMEAQHKVNVAIPQVALLDLVSETPANGNFSSSSSAEARDIVRFQDSEKTGIWVNYSSIVRNQNHRRKVVAMVQGEIPEGMKLKVKASGFSGSGKGRMGEPEGEITLSHQPSDIIVDIGSCYTGTGVNNGHHLTYTIEQKGQPSGYAQLPQEQTFVNVVYTLTDYN